MFGIGGVLEEDARVETANVGNVSSRMWPQGKLMDRKKRLTVL